MCLNSDQRQQQLKSALQDANQTVDQMCGNPIYQASMTRTSSMHALIYIQAVVHFADYLKHAPCIKSMATDDGKCRRQLGYLVDQVSALSISNIQICWYGILYIYIQFVTLFLGFITQCSLLWKQALTTRSRSACCQPRAETAGRLSTVAAPHNSRKTYSPNRSLFFLNSAKTMCKFRAFKLLLTHTQGTQLEML